MMKHYSLSSQDESKKSYYQHFTQYFTVSSSQCTKWKKKEGKKERPQSVQSRKEETKFSLLG